MRIYQIAFAFVFLLILLVTGVVLFAVFVPMNFSISAFGRVEPRTVRRVDVAESGKLVYLINKSEFKKGELLFELESEREHKKLGFLKEEAVLLEKEKVLLQNKIAFEKKQYKWTLRKTELMTGKIKMELELQKRQLDINKKISDTLEQQKKLDENLKEQEAQIFSTLYKKNLLPKIEFLKIMYEKSLSKAAAQEAENRTSQMIFENEVQAKRLEAEQTKVQAERRYLQTIPDTLTSVFEIENRLLQIKEEISELEMSIRNRKYYAPFDGTVMLMNVKDKSFVQQDQIIMDIADNSGIIFTGVLTPDKRSEIVTGMKAEIYMDNYFFHKYGTIKGKVLDIQTDLPSIAGNAELPARTSYYVTLSVDKPFRQFEAGLTGRADIITFHGTIVEYFRQKQLGR